MKLPVIPTILVAAAVATMIGLGVWQIQRAEWKHGLIARFESAATLPEMAWPSVPPEGDALYFRRASGFCVQPVSWRAVAGQNRAGEAGWSHIVQCRTGGAEGPGMQVDMGWSNASDAPRGWRGGKVRGMIAPDKAHRIRLISDQAAPGLEPSARPSPASVPNNHMFYAFQWFFFAIAALVIYWLALRKRNRPQP